MQKLVIYVYYLVTKSFLNPTHLKMSIKHVVIVWCGYWSLIIYVGVNCINYICYTVTDFIVYKFHEPEVVLYIILVRCEDDRG